jgi:hypothetical protein
MLSLQPVPAQRMVAVAEHLLLLEQGTLRMEISRSKLANDVQPVNREVLKERLAFEIFQVGEAFYGHYKVMAGAIETHQLVDQIKWLPHKCEQRGIGFIFGETKIGEVVYPARRYSLLSERPLDMDLLYVTLTGTLDRKTLSKVSSTNLEDFPDLMRTKPIATPPAIAQSTVAETERLATVLKAVTESEASFRALSQELGVIEAENVRLESLCADRPDREKRIQARLRELGL